MMSMSWFSSKVRFICLIEPEGATRYQDSLYIFRAKDFKEALSRAIELGRSNEEEYLNAENQKVAWKLKEVISLDILSIDTLDGVEVYSEPVDLAPGEVIPFDTQFHPEQSKPTQTI